MELSKKIKFALWWDRVSDKQKRTPLPVKISREGRSVSRIVISLPEHRKDYDFAGRFILSLNNALGPYSQKILSFIGSGGTRATMGLEMTREYLLYSPQDLNRMGLPSKALKQEASNLRADVLIDLNTEFSPISAVLVRATNILLKVGFYSELGEYYYNILLQKSGNDIMESGFKELHQLLGIK